MKNHYILLLIFMSFSVQSQDKLESSVEEFYDGASWINLNGYNYNYDTNGNLISSTQLTWNGSGWENKHETTYVYNSNNRATSITDKKWDSNQFIESYNAILTYDTNNKATQFLNQDWDGTQWVDLDRTIITYNSGNGELDIFIIQNWDGAQWQNKERGTASFAGSNLEKFTFEEWDGTQWNLSDRDRFIYNSDNIKISTIIETWDGTMWNEENKTEYEWDSNGNRLKDTDSYNGGIQSKTEYDYHSTDQMSNFSHPFMDKTGGDFLFEDFPYSNRVLGSNQFNYDSSTSSYTPSIRTTHNYNDQLTLSIKNNNDLRSIKIYPNPVTDIIHFEGLTKPEQISIFNIIGRKVAEYKITNNNTVNIRALTNGIYLMKFENGNTIKLVKK